MPEQTWYEVEASDGVSNATTLANLVQDNNYKVLYFKAGDYPFSSNASRNSLRLHEKLKLILAPGAKIIVNQGFTLTINATLEASFNQIFEIKGILRVSGGQNPTIYPVWWGVNHLDKMMASVKDNPPAIIDFLDRQYRLTKTLEIVPGIKYTANGATFGKSPSLTGTFEGPLLRLLHFSSAKKNVSTIFYGLQFISTNEFSLELNNEKNNITIENCIFTVDASIDTSKGIHIRGKDLNVIINNLICQNLNTSIRIEGNLHRIQINQMQTINCKNDFIFFAGNLNLLFSNMQCSGTWSGIISESQVILTNIVARVSSLSFFKSKLICGNSMFEIIENEDFNLILGNAMFRNCQWSGFVKLRLNDMASFADCQFISDNSNLEISSDSSGVLRMQGGFIKGKGIICRSGDLYFYDIVYQTLPECTFLTVQRKITSSDPNVKMTINGVSFKKSSLEDKLTYLNIQAAYGATNAVQITHQNMIIQKNVLSVDLVDDRRSISSYQFLGQRIFHGTKPTDGGGLINDLFYGDENKYYRCTSSGSNATWKEFRYIEQG